MQASFEYEKYYANQFGISYHQAIGVDEVGRGALAGHVIAAAVVLHPNIPQELLLQMKDSKKLSAHKRQFIAQQLQNFCQYSYGMACVEEIDNLNILQASLVAMQRSVNALLEKLGNGDYFILVDGNQIPKVNLPLAGIIKGDAKSYSIASASILAKVYRDNLMTKLAENYPHYAWDNNMGYGTKTHLHGIDKYGITEHHRKSFAPVKNYLKNAYFNDN